VARPFLERIAAGDDNREELVAAIAAVVADEVEMDNGAEAGPPARPASLWKLTSRPSGRFGPWLGT
jgi:hypothetical protein